MRREDIIDSLEYIDDEYIEEADRARSTEESAGDSGKIIPVRKKVIPARKWGTLVASLAVLAVAAFVLTGVLRTRSGNMNAAKSTEAVVEEQADAYAAGKAAAEPEMAAEAETAAEPEMVFEAADRTADEVENVASAAKKSIRIRVTSDVGEIVFALNDTPAAESLAAQLPLSVDTELYSDNEIIFHPEEPLAVENGMEGGGTPGYLGYFEPWNNVVMYYGDFDEYPGLYILGEAVSGAENIKDVRGGITIERITDDSGE